MRPDVAGTSWFGLCPFPMLEDAVLVKVAACLAEPAILAQLSQLENEGEYPADIRSKLHSSGMAGLFTEEAAPSKVTMYHLCALNAITAFANTSLAITVGVNALALLPLYIAGTQEQLGWTFSRLKEGAYCSFLLSELSHGSDLLGTRTRAEPGAVETDGEFHPTFSEAAPATPATHYRLRGEKQLINGGSRHELLVVLARTSLVPNAELASDRLSARGSLTLLLAERDPTVESLPRWHTLPAPGADISGVRFSGTIVPANRRIGREGGGLAIVQKTLALSRGGIGALASGLSSRALKLAFAYARERKIYGAPLLNLGAIADHLLRMQALERLIASVSLKATAMANARGFAAAHYTSVAKYACCVLAEELVTEGRYLLGSRSLLHRFSFARVIDDVLLYGVFDGTSHVVLDQIQARLTQMAAGLEAEENDPLAAMAESYATPPQSLIQLTRQARRTVLVPLARYLGRLETVGGAVSLTPLRLSYEALMALTRECRTNGVWDADQGLRFGLAKVLAYVESLVALVELGDWPRRKALGMSEPASVSELDPHLCAFTYGWLGGRIVAELRRLWFAAGLHGVPVAESVERQFISYCTASGRVLKQPLVE